MRHLSLLILAVGLLIASPALAQLPEYAVDRSDDSAVIKAGGADVVRVYPSGVVSTTTGLILGTTALTCDAAADGALLYDNSGKAVQFCDGTAWSNLSSGGIESVTGEPAPAYIYLDDLTDVSATSPSTGECLVYDGVNWADGTCGSGVEAVTGEPAPTFTIVLDDLSDVAASAPSAGECLTYDGANWVDGVCGSGVDIVTGEPAPVFTNQLVDLSDVSVTSPSDGATLTYDNAASKWIASSGGGDLWSDETTHISHTGIVHVDGQLGIGLTSPDVALDVSGSIEYTGTLSDVSDRRLKTDITPLPAGQLDKILALEGVSFRMKDAPAAGVELGLIAQDVETQFPALVNTNDDGIKSLNYVGLIAPMIEAIKQQQAHIRRLEARIETLEAQQ